MPVPAIHGSCDARFAPVREALAENFRHRGEIGAAVSVTLDGRPVVEVWGGWKDREKGRPWEADTLVDVFSVGKAMAATCLLMLVEEGQLDLDDPVARHWPGFGAAAKEAITARWVLAHRAGLPGDPPHAAGPGDVRAGDDGRGAGGGEPWWEPGRLHGYHVNTFGFLVGEIVRRIAAGSRSASSSAARSRSRSGQTSISAFAPVTKGAWPTTSSNSIRPSGPPGEAGRERVKTPPRMTSGLRCFAAPTSTRPGSRVWGRSTRGPGERRSCPRPTATRPQRASPGSTRRSPAAGRSTGSVCWTPGRWKLRSPNSPAGPTSCWGAPRDSALASSSPSPSGR